MTTENYLGKSDLKIGDDVAAFHPRIKTPIFHAVVLGNSDYYADWIKVRRKDNGEETSYHYKNLKKTLLFSSIFKQF